MVKSLLKISLDFIKKLCNFETEFRQTLVELWNGFYSVKILSIYIIPRILLL